MTDKGAVLVRRYRFLERRKKLLILLFLFVLLTAGLGACCVGVTDLSPRRILVTWLPFLQELLGENPLGLREQNVLLFLRMPRVAMAIVAGMALASAGTVMQAITGNAMASPFTTGLSSAAALGAAAAILFFDVPVAMQKTVVMASAFGMTSLCAFLVYGLSSLKGMGAGTLILSGIALNYLFSALNASMQFIANEQQLPAIVHWTFGNLTGATWSDIGISACATAAGLFVFLRHSQALNLMAGSGDEGAEALGIDVKRTRLLLGATVTLMTAIIVSVTGTIGFVGLVAPHIARLVIGGNHRFLMPLSIFTGAFLMLLADTVGRTAFSPSIVPVGIVVSFLGVPMFLYLILRERRRAE